MIAGKTKIGNYVRHRSRKISKSGFPVCHKLNCVTAHNSISNQELEIKDEQTHGQKET